MLRFCQEVRKIHLQACAVGGAVVVLASNFERVQVIRPIGDNEQATCLDCCNDSGKVGNKKLHLKLILMVKNYILKILDRRRIRPPCAHFRAAAIGETRQQSSFGLSLDRNVENSR